jgi:hypothetical protein
VVSERSNEIRLKLSECFQLHLSTDGSTRKEFTSAQHETFKEQKNERRAGEFYGLIQFFRRFIAPTRWIVEEDGSISGEEFGWRAIEPPHDSASFCLSCVALMNG